MDLRWSDASSKERFSRYLARLSRALGHADRVGPFRSYCTGLLLPEDRKSVEPMGGAIAPRSDGGRAPVALALHRPVWDEKALLRAAREAVLPALTAAGPVAGWIVDDTGFPKKGRHSVGVPSAPVGWSKRLAFPTVTDPAAPPLRTERHLPTSIATIRRRIHHALLRPGDPAAPSFSTTVVTQ